VTTAFKKISKNFERGFEGGRISTKEFRTALENTLYHGMLFSMLELWQ